MLQKMKYIRKRLAQVFAILLFIFIMFTNIKIGLMENGSFEKGDISLLGLELSIFSPIYAYGDCSWICSINGPCPGTMPELGVSCSMYTIGSPNCGITGFHVYVSSYSGNYCQFW